MKQFLYLDSEIVTSIIAQAEKGLITQTTEEETNETGNRNDKRGTGTVEAKASGGFLKMLKAEADLKIEGELLSSKTVGTSTKAVAEKILHDAAFDIAYDYIEPQVIKIGDQDSDEEGRYLKLTRVFDYIDFTYIEKLFDKDGIIEFLKKSEAKQIETEIENEKEKNGANRQQLRKAGINLKKEMKKAIEINNQEYDDIANLIKAFRGLLPYDRMLISSDGYLIPLDDQYFRINPSSLGFKYGGEITCVGMVTNIIGESTNPGNDENFFATIQFTVNEALRMLLPTVQKDLCVLHPIAVYYGE